MKKVKAASGVGQRWQKVADWLAKNQPEALKQFRRPATAKAIAAAEAKLERKLPADYKEFLAIHNGQETDGPMVEWATLLPVDKIAARYKSLIRLDPGADEEEEEYETDKKVKPVFYSPGWIPIGVSPRGRDLRASGIVPANESRSS